MAIQRTINESRDSGDIFPSGGALSSLTNESTESTVKNSTFLVAPDKETSSRINELEPEEGRIVYNDTAKGFVYWNGAEWVSVGGASGESGYSHTGAFADKPTSNNYVWEAGTGVNYTAQNVADGDYKVFSLNRAVHEAVDNPYWSDPTPSGVTGIGLFQGANLPQGIDTLVDYDYVYNDNYDASGTTGYEGSTGRIDLSDCVLGDQLRVRFDFNVIPQIANTTLEPALWYSNRDANDDITFTFPLTTSPVFYGTGTVGNPYLNRVEISAWITSQEDINALVLPAIKSDNPVIIQPLGLLITIIR